MNPAVTQVQTAMMINCPIGIQRMTQMFSLTPNNHQLSTGAVGTEVRAFLHVTFTFTKIAGVTRTEKFLDATLDLNIVQF